MHMHDGEAQRERDLKMTQSKPFDRQIQYFKSIFFSYDTDAEVGRAWCTYKARRAKGRENQETKLE
jgi:hypothetical protein